MATRAEIAEFLDMHARPMLEALVARANCEKWRPAHVYSVVDATCSGNSERRPPVDGVNGDEWSSCSLHTQCDNCIKINELGLVGAPCLQLDVMAVADIQAAESPAMSSEPTWNVRAHLLWSLPPDAHDLCGFEAEGTCDYYFRGTAPREDREALVERLSQMCRDFEIGLRRAYPPSACQFTANPGPRSSLRFLASRQME